MSNVFKVIKKDSRSTSIASLSCICDALPDLVPFVQFKKREKHPHKNGAKSSKAPHLLRTLHIFSKYFSFFINTFERVLACWEKGT